jgi:hypothetical protein
VSVDADYALFVAGEILALTVLPSCTAAKIETICGHGMQAMGRREMAS